MNRCDDYLTGRQVDLHGAVRTALDAARGRAWHVGLTVDHDAFPQRQPRSPSVGLLTNDLLHRLKPAESARDASPQFAHWVSPELPVSALHKTAQKLLRYAKDSPCAFVHDQRAANGAQRSLQEHRSLCESLS
jgi:hypothetical protein